MLLNWPAPFLFWTEVNNHNEIKKTLLPKIKEQVSNPKYYNKPLQMRRPGDSRWDCEVVTTFFDRDDDDVKNLFTKDIMRDIIASPMKELFNDPMCLVPVKPTKTNITEIWYNHYESEYFQEIHAHHGATFSGIYLLELNEPNTTVFYNNMGGFQYSRLPGTGDLEPENRHKLMGMYTTEHIKEGNVLLFPSEFSHSVRKSTTSRTTVSFNLLCEFN